MWSVSAQFPHSTHFPRSLQFQTGQVPVLSVSIVKWLSRSLYTRKVPSSKLGGNSLLFKAVVCLETTFKLSPLSKISSVPNGARASVICFHSVSIVFHSSKLGGNSLLFKAVFSLGTSPSLDPLSKISSVPNGARATVICFHSVVVITFALHAKGSQVETGWTQSLV